MRFWMVLAVVFATLALCGCGSGNIPRSRVHGVVKYQGKPLADSTIIFIASDNKTHLSQLKADGSYDMVGVAQGPVKVSIQQTAQPEPDSSEQNSQAGMGKGDIGEKKDRIRRSKPSVTNSAIPLPALYTDPEKSGLTFDLKEPDQEWSIDLK